MTHLDNAASCNFVRLTQIHHQACRVSFTQTWPPDAFQLSTLSLSSSLYHSCRGGCSWEPIKHWRLTLWTVSWPAISPSFRLRLELVKTCPPSGFFPGHSRSSVLSWRMRPHALQDFGTDSPRSVTFDSVFTRGGAGIFSRFLLCRHGRINTENSNEHT